VRQCRQLGIAGGSRDLSSHPTVCLNLPLGESSRTGVGRLTPLLLSETGHASVGIPLLLPCGARLVLKSTFCLPYCCAALIVLGCVVCLPGTARFELFWGQPSGTLSCLANGRQNNKQREGRLEQSQSGHRRSSSAFP